MTDLSVEEAIVLLKDVEQVRVSLSYDGGLFEPGYKLTCPPNTSVHPRCDSPTSGFPI